MPEKRHFQEDWEKKFLGQGLVDRVGWVIRNMAIYFLGISKINLAWLGRFCLNMFFLA